MAVRAPAPPLPSKGARFTRSPPPSPPTPYARRILAAQVRIAGVNKGTFADAALLEAQAAAPVDFVLCIGDDEDDEYMLSALTARASHPSMLERLHGRFFTVTVGARLNPSPRSQPPGPSPPAPAPSPQPQPPAPAPLPPH